MEIVTKIAPLVLALIMLGLGLGLSINDFARILKTPRDFFIGFFSQLIILPIVALTIAISLNLPSPLAIGLMIIAAAPGGVTSNVLTKFANGDVALSISLTAITSLICIISVPIIVINSATILGVTISKEISIIGVALKMATVVTLPVIIGMVIRALADNFISSKISIINKLTGWLFVIVFAAIWIEEKDNIFTYLVL
jgi:BASS family bile acid:Na+ symporter